MSAATLFTCNACGNTGMGVPGDYICPDPPKGWIWWYGSDLRSDGPHACSRECWERVKWSPDGKIYLPDSHERRAERERESATRRAAIPAATPPPPEPRKRTYIYFAQRGESGPIKIGVSGNVKSRVSALQTNVAEPVRLLASMVGTRTMEAEIHSQFHAHRLRGEWFRPVPELLAYVAELSKPA
jgi:hypothetical protein